MTPGFGLDLVFAGVELHIRPKEHAVDTVSPFALRDSIDQQLHFSRVGIDLHVRHCVRALGETPAGDVQRRLVRPIRLVKIKRVLLRLPVVGHQPLVVPAQHTAFTAKVAREIEHVPDETAPDEWSCLDCRPRRFVNQRLPFFRMPLTGVLGLFRILLVLCRVCARAVFAHAKSTSSAGATMLVEPLTEFIFRSGVPAGINVPAQPIGDLVHLWKLVRARRGNRWPRRVFAVGDNFQILQFAVRVGAAGADFIE